jgi:hypothetical protein
MLAGVRPKRGVVETPAIVGTSVLSKAAPTLKPIKDKRANRDRREREVDVAVLRGVDGIEYQDCYDQGQEAVLDDALPPYRLRVGVGATARGEHRTGTDGQPKSHDSERVENHLHSLSLSMPSQSAPMPPRITAVAAPKVGTSPAIPEAIPAAPAPPSEDPSAHGPASLIAQAVVAAVVGCSLAIAALPPAEDPEFNEQAAPILADLRQLEAIALQATHISRITPKLIKALGTVRRHHDELMTLGASAPDAPLAQRLYAARREANLSTLETAQAAGVDEEMIVRAEAEESVPGHITDAIETLIGHIN